VQWLVHLISGNVPPFDKVSFDSAFAVDLYGAAQAYGIEASRGWLGKLLAERVANDPWGCLARAWKGPDINLNLVETVIKLLPSYDILSFATTIHAQMGDLTPEEMLCLYPFDRHITLVTQHGPLEVDFPPFFAFALSITRVVKRSQYVHKMAANGDKTGLELFLLGILLGYDRAWEDTVLLGKTSDWISEYIE
jgi:hypothetical protein